METTIVYRGCIGIMVIEYLIFSLIALIGDPIY